VLPIVYPKAQRYCERHVANARGAALLVATAVQTGERLDELRHMRLEDIGTDEIRVAAWGDWSPKNHRNRTIPVPSQTATLAKEFVAWRDHAVGLNGQALVVGEHWISEQLDAAWAKAELAGDAPRMHDCRRTFATELHRSGHPLTLVRDRMGHGDVETTEGYLGRYRSDRDRVVPDMGVGAALFGAASPPTPDRKTR
jgi:integrase